MKKGFYGFLKELPINNWQLWTFVTTCLTTLFTLIYCLLPRRIRNKFGFSLADLLVLMLKLLRYNIATGYRAVRQRFQQRSKSSSNRANLEMVTYDNAVMESKSKKYRVRLRQKHPKTKVEHFSSAEAPYLAATVPGGNALRV
jgi:hypothetical protein